MAGKALQHGSHPQLALPGKDLLFQLLVTRDPALRQRSAIAVQAAHPLKRQVGRASQEVGYLAVVHSQPSAHGLPHGLLPGDRQRHVHAVERHPIDQLLPLRPIPPRQSIGEATVVEKIAVLGPARLPNLGPHRRQGIGQVQLAAVPRDVAMGIVLEIPIQAHRHGHAVVAANDDSRAGALDFKNIAPLIRGKQLKGELIDVVRKKSRQKRHGGLPRIGGRLGPGDRGGDGQDQPEQGNDATANRSRRPSTPSRFAAYRWKMSF